MNNTSNNVTNVLTDLITTYGLGVVLIELGKIQQWQLGVHDNPNYPHNTMLPIDYTNPVLTDTNHSLFGFFAVGDSIAYDDYCNEPITKCSTDTMVNDTDMVDGSIPPEMLIQD